MILIVGTKSAEHCVRIGSESHCLFGRMNNILEISDSEAGLKVENSIYFSILYLMRFVIIQ